MTALQPGDDGLHHTYCRLCEAQCGLTAQVDNGKIIAIHPDREHPVSKGHLCVKAPGMLKVTYDDDRVLSPMKRMGAAGEFRPVSWDDALDDIALRLKQTVDLHGGTSLASYIGNPAAFSTMHYAYGFGFIRMFGSDKVYNAMQVDTGGRSLAADQVFGDPGRWPFPDLPDTEFLMIFGGNPLISHMSLICAPRARNDLDAISKRGGVVVVDPRLSETARRYEHQPIKPDTDVWLLVGILRNIIERGDLDDATLTERVVGWGDLRAAILDFDAEDLAARCSISSARIAELANRFVDAKTAACYGRVGTNRGRYSTLCNILMDAINLSTGNFALRGGSIIGRSPFEAQAGVRRPSEYGKQRSRVGNLPIVSGTQPGGALAAEITTPGQGQIRALFLDSGNPVMAYPDGEQTVAALQSLDLFVSLDLYMNESNRHADYILPVPTFYERADVNDLWAANAPEPWVHYVDAVVPPRGDSRHEYSIYDAILRRLDMPDVVTFMTGQEPLPDGARRTHMELADTALRTGAYGDQFGAEPDGLSLQKLATEHPSGLVTEPRMDADASWDRIAYEDGKARLWNELIEAELLRLEKDVAPDKPGDLRLFGRRVLHGMNSWMHNSERVIRNSRPTLLMHPLDARDRQIEDGQSVRVRSKTNAVTVTVEVSEEVVPGAVNYPHGFGHQGGWSKANQIDGANINLLASAEPADWEQVSGNCHLDGIPVEVTPQSA